MSDEKQTTDQPLEVPPDSIGQRSWRNLSRSHLAAWVGLLLGVALIGFLDMPAMMWPGDPTMWREETRSLLIRHSLAIDPQVTSDFSEGHKPGQYFVQNIRNGKWYSKYGIANSLMSLPPMTLQLILKGNLSAYRSRADVLIYNFWNLFLSLLLAAVLMRLTGLYTRRLAARIVFVGVTFYCTYLWIYLRAQSSELYQTLFYSAAFLFLVQFLRGQFGSYGGQHAELPRSSVRTLYLMWLLVGALVFARILYLLLVPLCVAIMLIVIFRLSPPQRKLVMRKLWPHVLLPPIAIVFLLGTVNFIKFGSPLLSGYHQWMPELHLPTGPLSAGLYGLLLHPRFSLFLYFPTFFFALFGVWAFSRRYPLEAMAALGSLVVFVLALAKIPTWHGEWTYGPRYILFALPVASLPLILVIDFIVDRFRQSRAVAIAIAAPMVIVLLYSAFLQFRANETHFFAFYFVRPPIADSEVINHFFDSKPVGMTIDELQRNRYHLDRMAWFQELPKFGPEETINFWRHRVERVLEYKNYYWFRGDQPELQL